MENEQAEIDLKRILFLLKRKLAFIISLSISCLIVAFIITKFLITPMYTTSVKLYVDNPNANNTSNNLNDLNYAQKVVNTYIEMLNTMDFYTKVSNQANIDMTVNEIKEAISFEVLNNTEIFTLTTETDSPIKSKVLADAASSVAIETIESLKQSSTLNIVSSAPLPKTPSSPKLIQNCVIGFFIGLFLSIVIVILKDIFSIRIKSEDDLENNYKIPILGVIPYFDQIAKESTDNKKGDLK